MSSLVTGSSGLLGRCLCARLRERGESLRLFDLVRPDETGPASIEAFVCGDVSDAECLESAARGVDVIYHLAAAQRMKPQFARWSEAEIFQKNLDGVRNVLRTAERCNIRKVVFISSSGVYGIPRTFPCTEDHPQVPLGAYGRSKLLAEKLCMEAVARDVDVTMFRPMSLFGPHMTGVFVMLFEWVRTGQPVYVLGRGANRVQTVSAQDVAEACILAAETPAASGAVFNLGSLPKTVTPVFDTIRGLVEHADSDSPILRIPAFALRNAARVLQLFGLSPIVPEHYILADRDFVLDIRAAQQKLGWTPRYDNLTMMTEAYDWYVAAGDAFHEPIHPLVRLLNRIISAPRRRAIERDPRP